MKRVVMLFIFLIFLSSISAIKITEVELNPTGTDAGYEWVELSSGVEVDLSKYKLVNNDGGEIILSGNFSGYLVYTFNTQWLDNSDEKVFLYKGNELVDETDILVDSKNNDQTWQICDSIWELKASTKEENNECGSSEETPKDEEEEEDENNSDESEDEELNDIEETKTNQEIIKDMTFANNNLENKTLKTINLSGLNPKDIKSEVNTFNLDKSNLAMFGFGTFCILIILLFVLKKNKFKKNEFN